MNKSIYLQLDFTQGPDIRLYTHPNNHLCPDPYRVRIIDHPTTISRLKTTLARVPDSFGRLKCRQAHTAASPLTSKIVSPSTNHVVSPSNLQDKAQNDKAENIKMAQSR